MVPRTVEPGKVGHATIPAIDQCPIRRSSQGGPPVRKIMPNTLGHWKGFARQSEAAGIEKLGLQGVTANKQQMAQRVLYLRTGIQQAHGLTCRIQRANVDPSVLRL